MRKFRSIKWLPVLMAITILIIGGFQVYWLQKTYEREKRTLEMRSNMLFRETVFELQASKLKIDRLLLDSTLPTKILMAKDTANMPVRIKVMQGQKVITLINTIKEKIKDSSYNRTMVFNRNGDENGMPKISRREKNRLIQFLYDVDSLQDSIKVSELEKAYALKLDQQNIGIPFQINRIQREKKDDDRNFNEVTLGFSNPIVYKLELGNAFPYLLKRLSAAILFSLFLIGVTLLSFTLLYRNILRQRRLATIKNEFISNITHELKTPIATVSVAIEALRSFSANIDPVRTKEYLDISANELQRLSLLVDKVLKLSMFEKKEVELKYEHLNMKDLVNEVSESMRLQFEKKNAKVTIKAEGDTSLEGDRLHLVSVIFNLLDNALKYTNGHPKINITIKEDQGNILLIIEDNGIGIPLEYHDKVFEKFFRVPTGNLHNAKGYGLGLSYVSNVVNKHKGSIRVDSTESNGSNFIIILPKKL